MSPDPTPSLWSLAETSTHQDHVIAHVIGATVLGYFVHDESLHLFLDMGFVWTIYLDGQMVLLPQVMAVNELAVAVETRTELISEIELLGSEGIAAGLDRITVAPVECLLTDVTFWVNDERRRLILRGDSESLLIETSLATGEIEVRAG
jgi:hypothetical protein